MTCIHCNNTPGEIYIHHVKRSLCQCGFKLEAIPREVQYLGLTSKLNLGFVHYYKHLQPFYCPNCHAYLEVCFYDCEDGGMVVDFSQLQKEMERIE